MNLFILGSTSISLQATVMSTLERKCVYNDYNLVALKGKIWKPQQKAELVPWVDEWTACKGQHVLKIDCNSLLSSLPLLSFELKLPWSLQYIHEYRNEHSCVETEGTK